MKKYLKHYGLQVHWFLNTQLGVNLIRTYRFLWGAPRFVRDLLAFKRLYPHRVNYKPCLHDWYESGGGTRSEYFVQDLLVSRAVFANTPVKHVDVGSRVDGFVANVASFREIEVFDVRETSSSVDGIKFKVVDFMSLPDSLVDYCDSVSCLHALEHFGLGRYGDPIDPDGYRKGLENLARILNEKGRLYLSVPVGVERVEFNANRVFSANRILSLAEKFGLMLENFVLIKGDGSFEELGAIPPEVDSLPYALGIYSFIKSTQ